MIEHLNFDVVIVGVGVSGLYAALNLSKERKILMICKENMENCDSVQVIMKIEKTAWTL